MGETADFFADEDVPRARVAVLLKHSSRLRRVRGLAGSSRQGAFLNGYGDDPGCAKIHNEQTLALVGVCVNRGGAGAAGGRR